AAPARLTSPVEIPGDVNDAEIDVGGRAVKLTNLKKVFWPQDGLTKGDLLRYYAGMAPVLLPHIRDRAMVMKRYPNGATGEFFFMKRAPKPRPAWIETCSIEHSSGNVIDFPMINDPAALLWVINLGCIDLNEWYARCDDVDRPDYLHFDVDPGEEVGFPQVVETAHVVNSTPVTWEELRGPLAIDDFRMDNVPARVKRLGDLWAPVTTASGRGRFDLTPFVTATRPRSPRPR